MTRRRVKQTQSYTPRPTREPYRRTPAPESAPELTGEVVDILFHNSFGRISAHGQLYHFHRSDLSHDLTFNEQLLGRIVLFTPRPPDRNLPKATDIRPLP
jgi:hypothetical protein